MTKKIQRSMLVLVFISIFIFSIGTSFIFYDTEKNKAIKIVKDQTNLIQSKLNSERFNEDPLIYHDLLTQTRISLIDQDGVVIFDNKSDLDTLDNHNDREEVMLARKNGRGEKERYSNSLLTKYYYDAILLNDGMVLRVSTAIISIYSLVLMILPFSFMIAMLVFIVAVVISRKLSTKIITPILKADLHSNLISPYEELDLYFNTMRAQKEEIKLQITETNHKNMILNAILNTMQEGLIIFGSDLKVVLANTAFLNMMNINTYSENDMVYRFINDETLIDKIKKSVQGESTLHQLTINDKVYQVHLSPSSILDDQGAILLFVDVTQEYENQKHREQFSANVSHELKTPLTSIRGLAELQANNLVKKQDIQDFGKKIYNQSNRLLELIEHILELSKFDENQVDPTKEMVNLKFVTLNTLDYLKDDIIAKDIKVKGVIEDASLYANYNMMEELMYNLIENAIKYSDHEGIIEVNVKEDNKLIIEVINEGKTIPQKDLPHIFERFYRVESSRDKNLGGTGLGLAIVKHIVNYNHGTIEVTSDEKTCFKVSLPKEIKS